VRTSRITAPPGFKAAVLSKLHFHFVLIEKPGDE
jgi:hypothetical protein